MSTIRTKFSSGKLYNNINAYEGSADGDVHNFTKDYLETEVLTG